MDNWSSNLADQLAEKNINVSSSAYAMLNDMIQKKMSDKFILTVMSNYDDQKIKKITQADIDEIKKTISYHPKTEEEKKAIEAIKELHVVQILPMKFLRV